MPAQEPSTVSRNALVILAVIAGGATLYWLAPILTPLALAMFLAVMIDGLARVLQHRLPHVSKRAALPLAILISVLMFGGAAFFVAVNARTFAEELLGYVPKLDALIAQVSHLIGNRRAPTVMGIVRGLDAGKWLGLAARAVQDFASTAIFVLIYLAFILASRRGWERKAIG